MTEARGSKSDCCFYFCFLGGFCCCFFLIKKQIPHTFFNCVSPQLHGRPCGSHLARTVVMTLERLLAKGLKLYIFCVLRLPVEITAGCTQPLHRMEAAHGLPSSWNWTTRQNFSHQAARTPFSCSIDIKGTGLWCQDAPFTICMVY